MKWTVKSLMTLSCFVVTAQPAQLSIHLPNGKLLLHYYDFIMISQKMVILSTYVPAVQLAQSTPSQASLIYLNSN